MNSDVYDFAKIQFLSDSTPFVNYGTSLSRQYVDDKIIQEQFQISGEICKPHYLFSKISLTKSNTNRFGRIYLSGTLWDRFGRSPHCLNQVIACWNEDGSDCLSTTVPSQQKSKELPNIGRVRIHLYLNKEQGTNIYNSVQLSFMDVTGQPLLRSYKFPSADSIFLYPLLTEVKLQGEDSVFVAKNDSMPGGYITLLHVYTINYTIPDNQDNGQIKMCGLAANNYGYLSYFNKIIATYDTQGNIYF